MESNEKINGHDAGRKWELLWETKSIALVEFFRVVCSCNQVMSGLLGEEGLDSFLFEVLEKAGFQPVVIIPFVRGNGLYLAARNGDQLGHFPLPMFNVTVGERKVASLIVPVAGDVPPVALFPWRISDNGNAEFCVHYLVLMHIKENNQPRRGRVFYLCQFAVVRNPLGYIAAINQAVD